MNILKDWSKFEKTLLFGNIIVVSTIGIIFKADLLTTACSIIGITTALLLAKGKNLGQLMGILITLLYSILSFKNKYYGEVLIYVFLMLPMFVVGTFSWIKKVQGCGGYDERDERGYILWLIIIRSLKIFIILSN